MGNGKTVLLWHDNWMDRSLIEKLPEPHSFVKNDLQSAASWVEEEDLHQLLHTPLSEQAYGQLLELQRMVQNHWPGTDSDNWIGIGQNKRYSSIKMYKAICSRTEDNPLFKRIWKTANRLRHKIFF